MCGRYALGVVDDELVDFFQVTSTRLQDWEPSWNIAPTSTIPIVIERAVDSHPAERVLGPARWSLTPSWSDTLETPYPTFNARSESVAEKPTFRRAFAHTRALIPASGYFEWQTNGRVKTPHYIYPTQGRLFAFAGLYSLWGVGDQRVVTATMLTREAPRHLESIHHRAPVALPEDLWSHWLDPGTTADSHLVDTVVDASEDILSGAGFHPVLPLRGDSADLTRPAPTVPQ